MQTEQSQEPESSSASAPSKKKTNPFTQFIERFKKNKGPSPTSSTALPGGEDRNPSAQGYVSPGYVREQRHHALTEADLKNHVASLETALGDAWPRRHHSPYRSVHALLVCWPDSDSNSSHPAYSPSPPPRALASPSPLRLSSDSGPVSFEATPRIPSGTFDHAERQGPFVAAAYQLADVLKRRYDIQAQVWKVPSLDNAQEMLAWRTKDFVDEHGGPDNLLIYWYGGMADYGNSGRPTSPGGSVVSEVTWYGVKGKPGIPARTVTKALSLARADVLLLNDSPFAQHVYNSQINGPGAFELLGSGSTDPNRTTPSFTRTLALMLDSPHLSSRGVSIPQLHRKLLDMASDSTYRVSTTSTTNTTDSHVLKPIPTYPVYIQMAQSAPHEREAERHIVLSRLDTSLATETNYARCVGEPGVVIHFKLARTHLSVRRWRDWILGAPEEAREVCVKACGKGEKLVSSAYGIR